MNIIKLLMIFILTSFSTNSLAYGSSSSTNSCKKPKFSQFTPAHLSAVAAESEFSFLASSITSPSTIIVNIKKQPVEVSIKKVKLGYSISGSLPESLRGTFARVDIKATGTNKCKGSDGWLLKIEE